MDEKTLESLRKKWTDLNDRVQVEMQKQHPNASRIRSLSKKEREAYTAYEAARCKYYGL